MTIRPAVFGIPRTAWPLDSATSDSPTASPRRAQERSEENAVTITTTPARADRATITPQSVHEVLSKHILTDGFKLVLDMERSHDVRLYDAVGKREILDFYTSFSTVPLGYNHPALVEASYQKQILKAGANKPANSDLYTVELAEFVTTFARTIPESLRSHLFFIAGGALAVENAMKAAFDWKHRKNIAAGRGEELGNQIIHFREAFHGRSGYTLSVTNTDPTKTRYFPKFDWPRITNPKLRFPVTQDVVAEVEEAEALAITEILTALESNPHDIAGLLIEPIQGEGGDNHFRPEFFQQLRRLADEHEFLLLFDEVQTGFGTTGKWWCFEHFGVEPDIFAFGKKTQVCGIAANSRLDQVDSVFEVPSRINSTWGGNLVDMIRCRRIIEVIEDHGLLDNVSAVGDTLLAGLRDLEAIFPGKVTNTRGLGFFMALDLPDTDTRKKALSALLAHNMMGLSSGTRSLRFRPALVVDEDTAREALSRLKLALQDVVG